jgi:MFS family permease
MKKPMLINHDFALLFFGRLVSDIGHHLYNFAIGWYILSLTNSASQAGYYMAFGGIIYVALTPLAGVLVDRLNRVKIIYITDYIRGVSILIAGLLILLKPSFTIAGFTLDMAQTTPQLVVLYLTAFIFSVNGALFAPAVTASIPYLVEDIDLQKANSLNAGQRAFVSIIGALSGGVLYGLLGVGFIFILTSVSYILSAISEMFIQTSVHEKNENKLTLTLAIQEFSEGFNFILQTKGMFMFVLVILSVNMFAAPLFGVAQPYFFNQIVQSDPIYYSLVGLAFSIGSIFMAIYLSSKPSKSKVHKPLLKGLFGFTIGVALLGLIVWSYVNQTLNFLSMYILLMVVSVGIGLLITYVNTPIDVALQRYIPKAKLGRVNSIVSLMAQGIIPFSTALAGILIESLTLPSFYFLVAGGMGLTALLATQSKSLKAF